MRRTIALMVFLLVTLIVAPAMAQDTCEIQRRGDESSGNFSLSTAPEFREQLLRVYEGARGGGDLSMVLAYQPGTLQMAIYYVGVEWAYLEGDGELETNIDGRDGPTVQAIGRQSDETDGVYFEVIAFNLTEELFRQIAGARRVRFRLPARRRLERELRPVHINCFKSFLEALEQ